MRICTQSLVDWKFARNIDSICNVIVCSDDIGSKIFQSILFLIYKYLLCNYNVRALKIKINIKVDEENWLKFIKL